MAGRYVFYYSKFNFIYVSSFHNRKPTLKLSKQKQIRKFCHLIVFFFNICVSVSYAAYFSIDFFSNVLKPEFHGYLQAHFCITLNAPDAVGKSAEVLSSILKFKLLKLWLTNKDIVEALQRHVLNN